MRRISLLAFAFLSALPLSAQPGLQVRAAYLDAKSRLEGRQPGVQFLDGNRQLERVYGPAFGGGATADEAFHTFVDAYAGLFSPGDARLVYQGPQGLMYGKLIAGTFDQYWGPYRVDGGRLTLAARNQVGFPIVLAVNAVKTVSGPVPKARISGQAAIAALKASHPSLNEFENPSLVIWMGETNGHLAWSFHASGEKVPADCQGCGPVPEHILAFVDAQTGQILEERSAIHTIDVNGNVSGWATPGLKPDQGNNPPTLQPMGSLRTNITGGNFAFSNAQGNYSIVFGDNTPVTVNAPLTGRWVNVVDRTGGTLAMSQSVTPPGPANFIFNPAPSQFTTSQINGYIQTNRVHDFVKAMNPSYPGIDIVLPCYVNATGSCNAFFTTSGGPSINFYQAATSGTLCPNMAYSTVVWHEYGHFVIYSAGTPQGAYGEGMSDTIASLLGDTPWTGEDFRGPNTGPLRSAINGVTYPSAAPIHTAGQIVSGSFWGTLQQLDATVGHSTGLNLVRQWAINSILLHPPFVSPGMTVDVLTLDDNDADITNGTPHYPQIAAGFGAKGLNAPPVEWVRIEEITRMPSFVHYNTFGREVQSVMRVQSNHGTLDPNTIKTVYRVNNGAWTSIANPLLAESSILVSIPLSNSGTLVDWYVEAKDTQGRVTRTPLFATSQMNSYLVANGTDVLLDDRAETDLGWTVANTSVTGGAWVRGNPNGTFLGGFMANAEDDSLDPGANCFFTGQGTAGGAVGSADLDGGPTVLTSPLLNLAGSDALVEYSRWFFTDDGDDSMVVQVSNNNGTSWVTVETVVGVQNRWVRKTFRLGQYVSGSSQVRIRFSTSDNPNNSITEAAVDHIVVKRIIP